MPASDGEAPRSTPMRSGLSCVLMMGALLAAAPARAQTGPTPAFPPPPIDAAADPATAPSEPWHSPSAELPLPEGSAPISDDTKNLITQEASPWYSPTIWLGPAPWDSGVELGLNGSSGTSDSLSIRTGAYIKRESRFSKLDFSTDYNLTMNGHKTTQDNAKLDVTHDWLIDDASPWTLFAKNDVFYDKFANFNVETNANLGVGYRWVHTGDLEFMTRVGSGASREFGGDNDHWVPESLIGLEYNQRVSRAQKVYGKIDYFPGWEQINEYRIVADVGWEIELVQPSNLSLKISASDRYDSTPDGVSPQLVNYSVLLLLKL